MKLNATVTGVDALKKAFDRYGKEGEKQFQGITRIKANEIAAEAKRKVRKDSGKLAQSIGVDKVTTKNAYRIFAAEKYAAFVEFGTGDLVKIPRGWEDIASLFKGKGIKKVNLKARPYFYPAFIKGSELYIKDLKNAMLQLKRDFGK